MNVEADVGTEVREDTSFHVAGLRLPSCPLFPREGAARTFALRPHPSDVILSSYPGCDTPLVDLALCRLLHPDLPPPSLVGHRLPCLEMSGGEDCAHAQKSPRLYKTYFPFRLIPIYRHARYVYVVRCPWEACTEYYGLMSAAGALDEPFETFFERFLEGDVPYGSYFRHVAPWNKRLAGSNTLVLCREHVEHNPRSALFQLAAFLGDPYLGRLLDRPRLESDILGELTELQSGDVVPAPSCNERQMDQIVRKVSQHFADTSLEHLWTRLLQKRMPSQ